MGEWRRPAGGGGARVLPLAALQQLGARGAGDGGGRDGGGGPTGSGGAPQETALRLGRHGPVVFLVRGGPPRALSGVQALTGARARCGCRATHLWHPQPPGLVLGPSPSVTPLTPILNTPRPHPGTPTPGGTPAAPRRTNLVKLALWIVKLSTFRF